MIRYWIIYTNPERTSSTIGQTKGNVRYGRAEEITRSQYYRLNKARKQKRMERG